MITKQTPFAVGRTAEIFSYEEGKVLKLFFPTIPLEWIESEIEISRYIQATELPVPKFFRTLELSDRYGIVYERIEGPSLLAELASKPWNVRRYAQLLASLHAKVHEIQAPPNLVQQRDWARGGIPETDKLNPELQQNVLNLLESMPNDNQLCHGDFHPGNIIMTHRGPVIIDWMTASRGSGSGDVARTAVILEAARVPEGTPIRWLLESIRKLFLVSYLKAYFQSRRADENEFASWRIIMAANFFVDVGLPEEGSHLLKIIEASI